MGLLGKHGFLVGVAGHASAGNLHFTLTPTFTEPESLERYEAFMEELVELIVGKYDGSLKAEHGTGRNMAPYVEREWGATATALMWRVKELCDPDGILGPGVVLNRDPGVHLRDLKTQPEIEAEATKCIECGFCEPVCPSRDLTTTPRQRIVVRREMARQPAGSPVLKALTEQYEYDAIQTCAADGTCRLACPVAIDTGDLIKAFRRDEVTPRREAIALRVAERYATVERLARASLAAPPAAGRAASRALRSLVSHEVVPSWPASMPQPAPASVPVTTRADAAAVYFPSCINRIFGAPRGNGASAEPAIAESLVAVSARAGLPVWIPDDVRGHCCSHPWQSKGLTRGAEHMTARVRESMTRWTDGGRLPLIVDATSCTQAMLEAAPEEVTIIDATVWAAEHLLPKLEVKERVASAALHPTCGSRHLRVVAAQERLARELADEVVVPASRPAAAWPATAACSTPSSSRRPRRPRPPRSGSAPSTPTSRATALRARAAADDRPPRTCRSCSCSIASRAEPAESRASIFWGSGPESRRD
jgi:D-lactate dehydrogenase